MKARAWKVVGLVVSLLLAVAWVARAQGPTWSPLGAGEWKQPESRTTEEVRAQPPLSIEFVSQLGGPCEAVALQNGRAYAAAGPRLCILDVSDPTHPVPLSTTGVLSGVVQFVAVQGDYAYVVAAVGLHVINVSDPTQPIAVGCMDISGSYSQDLAVAGSFVYFSAGTALCIVDVSYPARPTLVGRIDMPWGWYTRGIDVQDGRLYLACVGLGTAGAPGAAAGAHDRAPEMENVAEGFRVFDLSDPRHPVEMGHFFRQKMEWDWLPPVDIVVRGRYAYLTNHGLRVVDLSDPTHPAEIGSSSLLEGRLDVVGRHAYVATGAGLRILDLSDPSHPTDLTSYHTPGSDSALTVSGSWVFVADNVGLRILDVFDPAHPVEASFYYTSGSVQDVAVSGAFVYVADPVGGLGIIDVSNPLHPRQVGRCATPGGAVDVAVAQGLAFVADSRGLCIVDVSSPGDPQQCGFLQYDPGNNPLSRPLVQTLDQRHACFANYGFGVRIVDASDPARPVEVADCGPGWPLDMAVAGTHLYVVCGECASYDAGNGLRTIDVSNAANPVEVSRYEPYEHMSTRVAVEGSRAYLTERYLSVVDVSNPSEPYELGFCSLSCSPSALAVAGNYVYAACGEQGISIFDVSDPTHPVEVATYDTLGSVSGVAVAADYVYVADGACGLSILRVRSDRDLVTAIVPPSGGSLSSTRGDTLFVFPSGAFTATVNLTYRHLWARHNPDSHAGIRHAFDLSAVYGDTGQIADLAPGQSYAVVVHYTDTELGWSTIEGSLALYSWDGTQWAREPSSVVNPATNTVTASPHHLSEWAVLGEARRVFLPLIRK